MNELELAAGLAATSNYRYADAAGDQLFVAGQVPLDAERRLIGADDPAAQARQCLDNLALLVAVHGFGRGDVRYLRIYVVGEHQNLIDAWSAVTDWHDRNVPPATLVGVTHLGHRGQLVEVDATIVRQS